MAVFDFLKDKRGEAAPAELQRPANVSVTLPGADGRKLLRLPVDDIRPNPNQPRKTFDDEGLEELADSIRQVGLIQPLVVRRMPDGYELVAGERRLRACKLLGMREVPCLVEETMVDQESAMVALIENLQRENLHYLEEAECYAQLILSYNLTQEELAARLGKSQSAVANKLRLLRLPPEVLASLRDAGCTERHARALLRLEDPEQQRRAADQVVEQELTVAQTEMLVDSLLAARSAPGGRRPTFIVKDVRLFLNTITRSLDLMRSAGVNAQCHRQDSDEEILLTIHIPRRAGS